MAHYDCTNCGAHMGCHYGLCERCTPKEVLAAQKKLDAAMARALATWNDTNYFAKKTFIELYTMHEREEYERLYEAGKRHAK